MKKAMISQPMKERSPEEIEAVRARAKEFLEAKGFVVMNTYFPTRWQYKHSFSSITAKRIWCLSKAIEEMADCDVVYMCKGWEDSTGCRVEHFVAAQYDLDVLYEDGCEPRLTKKKKSHKEEV